MTRRHRGAANRAQNKTAPQATIPGWAPILIPAALVLAVLVIYAAVWAYPLSDFDDPGYVGQNAMVHRGLTAETIAWAFTARTEANWHPLTWLSHMLDVQLFGLNYGMHHGTSVLLHAATSVLLFWTFRRMTGETAKSAVVAALFAVHPLHVESVAWVAERKDALSGFLWILTLAAYAAYVRKPGAGRYILVALLFAFGLMAKPMLVTLPMVLLLIDFWPLRRAVPWPRLALEKIPLLAMSVVSSIVTYTVQHQAGATESLPLPPAGRVANAVASYGRYVGKTLWPANLAAFYPFNALPPDWMVTAGMALLVGGMYLAWRQRQARPYIAVGWLWYAGTLVPAIGLVQVGLQSMADRYTYIPSIGLFLIVAWGVPDLAARWPGLRAAVPFAAGAVIVCLALAARVQVGYWKSPMALWNHALEVTSDNFLAHTNLAKLLQEQGHDDEAEAHFAEALRINPSVPQAINGMGVMADRRGKPEVAMARFMEALQIRPGYAEAHYNLGRAYINAGKLEDAAREIRIALDLRPEYPDAHNNLGMIFVLQRRNDEALEQYSLALRSDPAHVETHSNLGILLTQLGRMDEGLSHLSEAARLSPKDPRVHSNLAGAMTLAGKEDQAVSEYVEAIRLNPNYADARNRLGALLLKQKRIEEAVQQFREVVRLRPNSADARATLARAEGMLR